MVDASSVGMFELYCKVQKTDLFFITKWRKRQKNTHTLTRVDFFLTSYIGHGDDVVSSLEEFKVTDRLLMLPEVGSGVSLHC